MAEFDYSNTILIVKPVGPDTAASLRSEHNTNRLKSFHFEDGVSSVSGYDDPRSRDCTPYVSRPPELQLHLQFDPGPKNAMQGFVFGTDEEKCDVQLLENPDPDKKKRYGISRQHFRIDFNWNSGFLRLNNMSPTNGTGMSAPSVKNGFQSLKYNNMHMLHPAEQTKVRVGTLEFEISFPTRGKYQRRYDRNWDIYRRRHGDDVPDIKPLAIQPTLEITQFVQHRQGRRNAYLLHDEIGTGQFGMVCKASDPRTGELFAAKQFKTRKPGWDAKAYMEIAISQNVSHEHIVGFVDSIDDGGGPVLVMEYIPLGNLTELQRISSEEVRTVLRQALQALAYLHDEKNITHRDIKPENILVRSRTPELFIKLCDFGLSTQSSSLKTHCGTELYAAAEIFTGSYTKSVDIWAMGVLGYQFIKGLPKHTGNLTSKDWSKKIRRAVDQAGDHGHDSAVSLLKSMLELNPLDRPPAKTCLSHTWIQSALPFSQPGLQQTNVGPRSLKTISEQPTEIWNPPTQLGGEMPDPTVPGVLRKRLRSSESITSRIQPSKRGVKKLQVDKSLESDVRRLLAEETDEHDREHRLTTSPGCTTRTPHVGYERNTILKNAGRGLPRVQITTGQTGQKAVLKRARSSFKQTLPANEDVPKVTEFDRRHVQMEVNGQLVLMRKEDGFLNATQIITLAKKNDSERKYILELIKQETKVEVLRATVGIPYPHSWINLQHGRNLCGHLGLEQKLQPLIDYGRRFQREDDGETVEPIYDYLTEKFSQFITIAVLPQPVSVRRSDLRINATHILRASGRNRSEMGKIRKEYNTAFDIVSASKYHQGTYVDFWIGLELCQRYGMAELEERLIGLQPASEEAALEARPRHARLLSQTLDSLPKSLKSTELAQTQMPRSNDSIREVIAEVTGFDSKHVQMVVEDQAIFLRKEDCFLNATQIIKLAKKDSNERKSILDKMKKHTKVDVKKADGKKAICGSWVNLQHGRILCNFLSLERQLQPLLEYAKRLQGDDDVEMAIAPDRNYLAETGVHQLFIAVRALPKPVMIRRLDFRVNSSQILGVAGRNESDTIKIRTEYRGAFDTIQHGGSKYKGTYVDFDVAIHLCRKYGLAELESRIQQARLKEQQVLQRTVPERTNFEVHPSDAAGQIRESMRPDSALPRERRDSQRTESRSQSNSSYSDDDIREEYPISDAASESSTSASETSIERESEPSSIRLGTKAAPLHQHTQYSLKEIEPQSPPGMISYYKSRDYQPQHSRLLLLKPDLKPPSRTASPYESFTNIY